MRYAMEDAAWGAYLYPGNDLSQASIAISLKRIADFMGCKPVPGPVLGAPTPLARPSAEAISSAKAHGWSLIIGGHCYACEKSEADCGCLPF